MQGPSNLQRVPPKKPDRPYAGLNICTYFATLGPNICFGIQVGSPCSYPGPQATVRVRMSSSNTLCSSMLVHNMLRNLECLWKTGFFGYDNIVKRHPLAHFEVET